jgi:transcriptional regulator with XRE-family HTH domain
VSGRSRPPIELEQPGRRIREVREELGLSTEALGSLLHYDGSHIRNVELGNTGHLGFAKRCEQVAATANGYPGTEALTGLAEFLLTFKPDPHRVIDTRRGTERKQSAAHRAEHLVGRWSAIWQTSRHGEEALVAETILMTASGNGHTIKMANAEDCRWLRPQEVGFPQAEESSDQFVRWEARCGLTGDGRWISGTYKSVSAARVNGIFRLKLDTYQDAMVGDWFGHSWDSERTHGLLVMARSDETAKLRLANERGSAPSLPLIPT